MNKQQLLQIKENLEAKQLSAAAKQGQLDGEKTKLKETFGVSSAKDAKELLNKKAEELDQLEEKFHNDVSEYKEKYQELLEV